MECNLLHQHRKDTERVPFIVFLRSRCIVAEDHWPLYSLAEKVTALEYYFQEWRFKHMKTVSRVIGHKPGTGGSSGVSYLVKALDLRFFPELWTMRTRMSAPKEGGNYAEGCPV